MPNAKEFDFEKPLPAVDDEDDATLAAIDEGIRDAKAGRTVPAEKVRRLLRQWITASLFTQRALSDFAEIVGHIAADNGEAASLFGNALLDHVDLLVCFPRTGKHNSKTIARTQAAAQSRPCLLCNPRRQASCEVLHFRHGSRKAAEF